MAGRIAKVRGELRAALDSRCPEKDWSFITKQIGMFSYTGMSPQQVRLNFESFFNYDTVCCLNNALHDSTGVTADGVLSLLCRNAERTALFPMPRSTT